MVYVTAAMGRILKNRIENQIEHNSCILPKTIEIEKLITLSIIRFENGL